MSLVEVLVALLLLGVVLSAAASSLIQFSRTATDNERRVQATALMNRLHEELQALPWEDAVVYEDELAELLADGDLDGLDEGPPWTLDHQELVTLPAPSGEGRPAVPEVWETVTIDDRDYDIIRLVTWSDRDPSIKRFITIVQWRLYDRVYEERFFSERAPTGTEAGDPERPRVVQFQVGPSPMGLVDLGADQPAQNADDILVTVRFSEPVDSALVRYRSVDVVSDEDPVLVSRELPLTPYISDPDDTGHHIAFRGTIPLESRTFPNGGRDFEAVGFLGSEEYIGRTSMVFTDGALEPEDVGEEAEETSPDDDGEEGDEDATDPYPELGDVDITSITVHRQVLKNSAQGVCNDVENRFVDAIVVEAVIDGLDPDAYSVSVTYSAGGSPRSQTMIADAPETFGGTNALFRLTLEADTDHDFRPVGNNDNQAVDETDFVVSATRPGSDSTDIRASGTTLSVYHHNGNNCR